MRLDIFTTILFELFGDIHLKCIRFVVVYVREIILKSIIFWLNYVQKPPQMKFDTLQMDIANWSYNVWKAWTSKYGVSNGISHETLRRCVPFEGYVQHGLIWSATIVTWLSSFNVCTYVSTSLAKFTDYSCQMRYNWTFPRKLEFKSIHCSWCWKQMFIYCVDWLYAYIDNTILY